MRLVATILNAALLVAYVAVVLEYGHGPWHAQEYMSTFLICGATLSGLVFLVWGNREPWFAFRSTALLTTAQQAVAADRADKRRSG